MDTKLRRLAPIGLWVAVVAVIASLVLFILQREWNLPLQISLGLVVIGLASYALLDPNKVRMAITGRSARYGSNATVLVIAFTGILVIVNYFFYVNDKSWDLTEDKENTLAPETVEVLEQLPDPVVAYAFYSPNISKDAAENLLEKYVIQGDDKFSYEFIDPVADPVAATEASVSKDGTIVLEMGEAREQIEFITEDELTSGLVRLMNPGNEVIYFLTGHGELNPEQSGDKSYAQLKEKLESKNYTVLTLNLLAENKIPDDASLIIIGGPLTSLSESEISLLEEYQTNGGALIVMEEPIPLTQMGDGADLIADYLAKTWGIILGKDLVVDTSSDQYFLVYAAEYGSHSITQKMQNFTSVFPTARSVSVSDAISSGVSQSVLIYTTSQSWAETDLQSLNDGTVQQDPVSDLMGPVSIAAVAENFNTGARLVVFGDSEFASDAFIAAYGNTDMVINSVDWAIGQEDLINLTTKTPTTRTLMTPSTLTLGLIFLGSIIVLPGIVLGGGITAWIIRRRRG